MIALLLACRPDGEPSELRELHGFWQGEVTILGDARPVLASFVALDGLVGVVQVEDPDAVRQYEVVAADAVPPLGFGVLLYELTGVRELTISVIDDLPPLDGYWETRTWCGEPPDGWCVEAGGLHLDRTR